MTKRRETSVIVFLLLVSPFCITGCRSASSQSIRLFSTPSPNRIAPQSPTSPTPTPYPITTTSPETKLPVNTTNLTSNSPPFFSGTSSIPNSTTSVLPPTSIAREPSDLDKSRYEAFRPIIPPNIAEPPATSLKPNPTTHTETKTSEIPKNTPNPEINELKKRITILETELKKAKESKPQATPPSTPSSLPKTPDEKSHDSKVLTPNTNKNEKQISLPFFNVEGVTTTKDEKGIVRISIVDTLLFMSTSWKLTPKAEELLLRIITEIKAAYPEAEIDIEGHTDNLDVDPKNPTQKHDIAAIKAGTIMDYCVKTLKYNPAKLKTVSYGSKHPIADNSTAEGRAKNNRIEIAIQQPK
ncbi:MAG: OmpA family protein [Planctomycetaceae bacterium]|nr:OmpA family protein [Planctomycetaceae bacterium]